MIRQPKPTVSIVIPSKDRRAGVQSLIDDLRRQDYPQDKLEILVIDDGSQPPYHLTEQNVRLIRHHHSQGAQKSRNEALAVAGGEITLILDDDMELIGNDYLSKAVEVFHTHPQVAAVFSRKIDVLTHNGREKTLEFSTARPTLYSGDLVKYSSTSGPIDWGHGSYFARRNLLLDLGGYDRIYGLNGGHSFREESDVHARLRRQGYKLWYLPDITIKHHIISTGGHGPSVGHRLYWIAHNHIIFLRRYFGCWPLRAVGFLLNVVRYSWVQGRFRYTFHMLCGYGAGWRNALRDQGPGRNHWLK